MSSSVARRALLVRAPDERAQAQAACVSPRGGKKPQMIVWSFYMWGSMWGRLPQHTGCGDRSYMYCCRYTSRTCEVLERVHPPRHEPPSTAVRGMSLKWTEGGPK